MTCLMTIEELNASMHGLAYIWTMFGWHDSVTPRLIRKHWSDIDDATRLAIWNLLERAAHKGPTILIWEKHSENSRQLLSQLIKPEN